MPILQVLPSGKVRWRAKWRDAEGTEQSATFDTEREARDHEIAEKLASNGHVCALDGCDIIIIRRGQRFCRKEHKAKYNNDKRANTRMRVAAEQRPPVVCKLDGCGKLVPQNLTGRPGEFCPDTNHGQLYWNQTAARAKGPSKRHRVTNVNETTETGDCSICGPGVKIWVTHDKYADGRSRLRGRCPNRTTAGRAKSAKAYSRTRKAYLAKIFYAYGLTEAQFDEMVIRQEGRCGSCSAELRNLQIDHDHVVGYNRGLLCQKCNTGGGKLGDSIEGVEAFLKYLRAAKARYQEGVEREAYDAANDG